MEFDTVKEKLLHLCKQNEIFQLDDLEASIDEDLMDAGAIDSMAVITLNCLVEENFSLQIPPEVMAIELRTIRDLIQYIVENS
jgi:acyl carrier protein